MKKIDLKDANSALQRFREGTLFPLGDSVIRPLMVTGELTREAGYEFTNLANEHYTASLGTVGYSGVTDEFEITQMETEMYPVGTGGRCMSLFAMHASEADWPGDHPVHENDGAYPPLLVDDSVRHFSLRLMDMSKDRWTYVVAGSCSAVYDVQLVIYSQEMSRRIPRAIINVGVVIDPNTTTYYASSYYNDGADLKDALSDNYRLNSSPFKNWSKVVEFSEDASGEIMDIDESGKISIQYSTTVGMIFSISKLDGTPHHLFTIPAEDTTALFGKGFTFSVAKYQSHTFSSLEHVDGVSPDIVLDSGLEIFASDANGFIEKVELLPTEYTDLLTVEGDSEPAVLVVVDDQRTITIPAGGEYGIYSVASEGNALINNSVIKDGFEVGKRSIILTDGDGNIHSVI